MREAQVDRDAARFFFRQTIGVGAGERLDQRCLAVIDMAGGGENEILRIHRTIVIPSEAQRSRGIPWRNLEGDAFQKLIGIPRLRSG